MGFHTHERVLSGMIDCAFFIPGDIDLPTGGYGYDRRLLALLPSLNIDVRHIELPASFPNPSAADLTLTAAHMAAVEPSAVLLVDGLGYGALPASLLKVLRQPIVALCHHPLGMEHGLAAADIVRLSQLEREALSFARHVIVTGGETRTILIRDFGVPGDRITVAVPGVDPVPRSKGTGNPVILLAVGSVVPRKGYDVLIEALARVDHDNWRLTIAGAIDRHGSEADRLGALIAEKALGDRIEMLGAVDDSVLAQLYDGADVFVMSSHFEGYGMVLSEAMARGLAIVTTRCGSAASGLPDTAALKVAPAAVDDLATALERVLGDTRLRHDMARASWLAGQQLPRWIDTARTVADVLKKVAA